MVTGPRAIVILQLRKLRLDLAVPPLPFRAAGAVQAVADIQVGEKFLAAHRAEAVHESGVVELSGDLPDLRRVLGAILFRASQLLQSLRVLVERHTRGRADTVGCLRLLGVLVYFRHRRRLDGYS